MIKKEEHIDKLFRETFHGYKSPVNNGDALWAGVESKIPAKGFFDFSIRQFNVYYASVITGAVIAGIWVSAFRSGNAEKMPEILIDTTEMQHPEVMLSPDALILDFTDEIVFQHTDPKKYSSNNNNRIVSLPDSSNHIFLSHPDEITSDSMAEQSLQEQMTQKKIVKKCIVKKTVTVKQTFILADTSHVSSPEIILETK